MTLGPTGRLRRNANHALCSLAEPTWLKALAYRAPSFKLKEKVADAVS